MPNIYQNYAEAARRTSNLLQSRHPDAAQRAAAASIRQAEIHEKMVSEAFADAHEVENPDFHVENRAAAAQFALAADALGADVEYRSFAHGELFHGHLRARGGRLYFEGNFFDTPDVIWMDMFGPYEEDPADLRDPATASEELRRVSEATGLAITHWVDGTAHMKFSYLGIKLH